MATGRILQFDEARGYGFVAADDGGEDVFLHASVFDGDPATLVPGRRVEFQTMAGDRGRKAYAAHIVDSDDPAPPKPKPAPSPTSNGAGTVTAEHGASDEEGMCDVLSEDEFEHEITELLMRVAPDLTGAQIVKVRRGLAQFGKKQGWIDD